MNNPCETNTSLANPKQNQENCQGVNLETSVNSLTESVDDSLQCKVEQVLSSQLEMPPPQIKELKDVKLETPDDSSGKSAKANLQCKFGQEFSSKFEMSPHVVETKERTANPVEMSTESVKAKLQNFKKVEHELPTCCETPSFGNETKMLCVGDIEFVHAVQCNLPKYITDIEKRPDAQLQTSEAYSASASLKGAINDIRAKLQSMRFDYGYYEKYGTSSLGNKAKLQSIRNMEVDVAGMRRETAYAGTKIDSNAAPALNSLASQSLVDNEIQKFITSYRHSEEKYQVDGDSMDIVNGFVKDSLKELSKCCKSFFTIVEDAFKEKPKAINDNSTCQGDLKNLEQSVQIDSLSEKTLINESDDNDNEKSVNVPSDLCIGECVAEETFKEKPMEIKENSTSQQDLKNLKQAKQSNSAVKTSIKQSGRYCYKEPVWLPYNDKEEHNARIQSNSSKVKETNASKASRNVAQITINSNNTSANGSAGLARIRHYESAYEISVINEANHTIEYKLYNSENGAFIRKLVFDLYTGVRI